jgi:hypothetical protein
MDYRSTQTECRIGVPRADFVCVCEYDRSLRPSPAASPLWVDPIGSKEKRQNLKINKKDEDD